MAHNYKYPVTITRYDDDGEYYVAQFDDPNGRFQGACEANTEQEALLAAQELLDAIIEFKVKEEGVIPNPKDLIKGTHVVSPSPQAIAKLELYQAMTDEGITKAELGRRLGWNNPQIARLFNIRHATRLDHLAMAAEALNRRLVIGTERIR